MAAPAQAAANTAKGLVFSPSAESGERRVTLRRDGDRLVLVDDRSRAVLAEAAAGTSDHVVVRGLEGKQHVDTLTVDLRGLSLRGGVEYDAGVGGFDTLNIVHDPARTVEFDYEPDDARGHRGRVLVDGTVIAYSGIEPMTNVGTAANVIFNLPAGTSAASLQDDGTPGNNTVQIASPDFTFESTTFTVPTSSLTVNGGGGTDTISVASSFSGDFSAALTINGTAATDTVTLNALTLGNAGGNSGKVAVTAKDINVTGTINTTAGSTGSVVLTAQRLINVSGGGVTTTGGAITLSANQGTPVSGNFTGISVASGSTITSSSGPILIEGKGGDTGSTNEGVYLGGIVSSTGSGAGAATITIVGSSVGGTNANSGLELQSAQVTSKDGAIHLTGIGGAGTQNSDFGVVVSGSVVSSTGTATITIDGTGGGSSGTLLDQGVVVFRGSTITSVSGNIQLNGTPGFGGAGSGSYAMAIGSVGGTVSSTGSASVTLVGDSITFDTSSAVIGGPSSVVTIRPATAATNVNLGIAPTTGVLGLTNDELARVTASTLQIGSAANTGGITVSAPITNPATWTTLSLASAGPFSGPGTLTVPTLHLSDASGTGHTWSVIPASIAEGANTAIPYSSTNVTVTGGSGSDTFAVTPGASTTLTIDGGNPVPPTSPGDVLNVDQTGTTSPTLSATTTVSGDQGSYTFGNRNAVNFSHIESIGPYHFVVSAPASATAGSAFSFTVTAFDQLNNAVTGYSGTVHFTSSDGQAVLPADTLVSSGGGTYSATLKTAGGQTITATDVSTGYTGTSSAIGVTASTATHFLVSAPANATAGSAFTITVTALDAFNNTATGYAGTVHFTTTDGQAVLPANSTLTNGVGTFSATLKTSGNQTITATDTVSSSISGTSNTIAVSAAAATHFTVAAPASATAGTAFSFTVTALDAFNNTATGYSGTVHFTTSDGQAVLPANSTLTNGAGSFSATLKTSGNQTITATDAVSSSITGTSSAIAVSAAAATHFVVAAPASATAGTAFSFTVTALDPFNNTATAYSGSVHFTTSDAQATLPANSVLASGTGTFSATLKTSGNQTITATDTVTPSIAGTSNTIGVSAAAATHFTVVAPASASAGTAFNFAVTALDQFNNTATAYSGTVHFTSSDGLAVLPANSTLTSGAGTFSATLKTNGNQTITATDTVASSTTGTSNAIAVGASAATHFSVTAPATATAGVALNVSVTALDAFNNIATAYSGTVHFTSSDGQAVLPADSTLTSGAGTFPATLKTRGNQTITASDGSITAASNTIAVSAAAATHFAVTAPAAAIAGTPINFTVTALDAFNNTATAYAGTLHFTSSDGQAVLPANSTLTSGTGSFSATLKTSGNQTLTASDGTITASSAPIAVSSAAASHFALTAPAAATAGIAFNVSITALDPFNNVVTGYGGTVHFTSSDSRAVLPANATLGGGAGTFPATLNSGGNQTITATDTLSPTVAGTSAAIAVTPVADLSITKSGPATANPGTNVTYTITVANAGPSDAQTVSVTDPLPSGTTFVSESQTAGPSFACTTPAAGAAGTVTCTIATLVSGTSASFTVVLMTTSASISNTATVSSATSDPNAANNSSTSATGINNADLSIAKSAAAPTPYGGFGITWTLVVANAGPSTATGITVTDVLPAGSSFVSVNPPGICSGTGTLTCAVGTLNSGASTTVTLVATAPLAGGSVTNTASVTAAQADPNPANNSASATISIYPAAAIPALSDWMLLLLAAFLVLIVAVRLG